MFRYVTFSFISVLLIFLSGSAQAAPPAPWRQPDAAPSLPPLPLSLLGEDQDDVHVVQLSPTEDTFVANGPMEIRQRVYGDEETLLVGRYNDTVTELRTLVGYDWDAPSNLLEILEAKLFFGVAGGEDREMPLVVYRFADHFDETIANWNNRGYWGTGSPVQGALGKAGYWYAIDVKKLLGSRPPRYMGFSIRSKRLENGFYKISHSKESDPELAPQLVIRYRLDTLPPVVWFDKLPEWGKPLESFQVHGYDRPKEETPFRIELQYQLDGGPWQTTSRREYPDEPGKTVRFRARGVDTFGNTSEWVYSTPVKLYSFNMGGRIQDHRGRVLPPVAPSFDPPAWFVQLQPETQQFYARMTARYALLATVAVPGYGVWEKEPVPIVPGGMITLTLPPPDNLLVPASIESPNLWTPDNKRDQAQRDSLGQGGGSLMFSTQQPDRAPAFFCHAAMLDGLDSLDMNQPTLGVHYWLWSDDNLLTPSVTLIWEDETGVRHPLAYARRPERNGGWDNRRWGYLWADFTPFRGQQGRLCISFPRPSSPYRTIRVYLDRFTLGSTPSELSVRIVPPGEMPAPGQRFPVDFQVTNHSPYTATARLRYQAGDNPEEIVDLAQLEPGQTYTHSVSLTMPDVDVFVIRVVAGKPEIDLTPADNRASYAFIRNPRHLYLPLVR